MKLSNKTIDILRNFGAIQPNLVVEPGSTISTLAEAKHIMAEAQIEETFDSGFGIYDVNEFLSAYSLFENPELEFSTSHVTIKSGSEKVKYHFADIEILTKKVKSIQMPPADLSFTITEGNINKIRKASSSLHLDSPSVSFKVEDGNIVARVLCNKNPSSNSYSLTVGKHDVETQADYRFNIDNLKLIGGDYNVEINNGLISSWKNQTSNIEYWIALDKTSTV